MKRAKNPDIKPSRRGCDHNWIPIMYGYPSPAMCDRANAGEIKIGGCIIRDTNPTLFCTKCEEYK